MNKIIKIILAILAGIETVMSIIIPIVISLLWVKIFGIKDFGSYLIYVVGLGATLFRAIKIGWMK